MTEEKKSVFGFLKNLVAEEVPEKPRLTPTPSAPAHMQSVSVAPLPGTSTAPDPQALAKLEARLQGALPPAYATFMETYESLKEDIADERTRFKVALKTSHTTTDQVLAALDQLLGAMETAHSEFSHSFEENKAKRLGEAQHSITATEELIKSNEAQLKSIQETIVSLRTKCSTDTQSMQAEAQRLEGVRAGFEGAHAQVVGRLAAHKNRILTMPKV